MAALTLLTIIFSAVSCSAMTEVAAPFAHQTGISSRLTSKSSGMLTKGIKSGTLTPDLMVTSNMKWMDETATAGCKIFQKAGFDFFP